jgi:hypothetical protein
MGIETYGSMVNQILNDVHDADVSVVTLTSVYQCDSRTYRQWTIDVCPMVRSQYQTHDDSQARSDLKVLW